VNKMIYIARFVCVMQTFYAPNYALNKAYQAEANLGFRNRYSMKMKLLSKFHECTVKYIDSQSEVEPIKKGIHGPVS
jgi:hypothetical protein